MRQVGSHCELMVCNGMMRTGLRDDETVVNLILFGPRFTLGVRVLIGLVWRIASICIIGKRSSRI